MIGELNLLHRPLPPFAKPIGRPINKLFGFEHILLLIIFLGGAVLLAFCLRKCKHKTVTRILKVISLFILYSDTIKWVWDYATFGRIDFAESLPMYICSITIFMLPFAGFGKGIIKRIALSYLCTLNIIGAIFGVMFSKVLIIYPIYHLNVLNSFMFHAIMLFVGVLPYFTKYYKPEIKDTAYFIIPYIMMSIPVLIVNKIFNYDYMFLNGGKGTPFHIIAKAMPKPLYILVMSFGIYFVGIIIFYIPTIYHYIKNLKNKKKEEINLQNVA